QVNDGIIPLARLDDAVRRILRVKMRAGLFDAGKPSTRPLAADVSIIGHPEHRAVARQAAAESLVLLKNNKGVLPINASGRVLVTGDGAHNIGKQTGGWTLSWQGTGNENEDFPNGNSIWEGIYEAVTDGGGIPVLSADGSYEVKPDVAVVVFGENPYAEFQGDRDHLAYGNDKNNEVELLKSYKAQGIPVVAVFISGRPMYATPEINAADAFVAAWLPGSEGKGVSDVIIGDSTGQPRSDFKGKLSFSWPKKADQGPLNVGDADYEPLFGYGYGLDYRTEHKMDVLQEFEPPRDISRSVFFENGPVAPYKLKVSAAPEWSDELVGNGGILKVRDRIQVTLTDRNVQEDSRRVSFSGKEMAAVYLHIFDQLDLSREANGDMQMGMSIRIDEAPSESVFMSVGDGTIDLSKELVEAGVGNWVDVTIPLKCFAEAGADTSSIDTPWLIATSGTFKFTLNSVQLVPPASGLDCPVTAPQVVSEIQ
ncbi:MAG: glycoside hydrolase family 3 C-terminal domain-containing protein, partial [Kordiimonas sp.]